MSMQPLAVLSGALALAACAHVGITPHRDGLVEYFGAQREIFDTGKAAPKVPLAAMSGAAGAYGVGAVAGLDGEITVFEGRPYVTKVRGDGFTLDHGQDHAASFAVWTRASRWTEQAVPAQVRDYMDLQRFVKARAAAAGIDTARPFPFLLSGTPAEVKWHINVDLTGGKPIDRELFAKSKAGYVARHQPMDIVGFHSESHGGVFISALAPGITRKDVKNAIHIHMVSRDGKSAGHIDDITMAGGMVLRLPAD